MKRKACMLATLLAVVVIIANIAYIIKDSFYYSLENLPTGTPIPFRVEEDKVLYQFRDQKYFLTPEATTGYYILFYEVKTDGKYGIRAEACRDDESGDNVIERKTIYWQIGETANMITWEDYTVVNINGVTIDFSKEVYDCRDYPNYEYIDYSKNNVK